MTGNHSIETDRFFMIMSNLVAAKARADVEAVEEWIDELDAMAMHAAPVFATRSAYEAGQAREWVQAESTGLPNTALHLNNVTPIGVPASLN